MAIMQTWRILASVCCWLGTLPAQEPDEPTAPAKVTTRVRVVGALDGLPRAGVPLHWRDRPQRPLLTSDGFWRVEDAAVVRLRHARRVITDPNGEAELPIAGPAKSEVWAGEPFALTAKSDADGEVLVWQVVEREPVAVRVVDAAGAPVAGFPVALHSGGKDLCVALSDPQGWARLGLDADYSALVHVAPAGWVGSYEGLPSLARSLPGRRGTTLVVPECGTLRLQALRGGQPLPSDVGAFALQHPSEYLTLASGAPVGALRAKGLEFPFVAVGTRFSGHVEFDHAQIRLEGVGPERPGAVSVLDVVVPWRNEVRLQIAAAAEVVAALAAQPMRRVVLVTDAARFEQWASVDAQGHLRWPAPLRLRGKRLLAVEWEAVLPAKDRGAPVLWWLHHTCSADLAAPTLDLGPVTLRRTTLPHGRVLDREGRPVAGAEVVVRATDAVGGVLLRTDAEGWFQGTGPIGRTAAGEPVSATVAARLGAERSAAANFAPGDGALTLQFTAAAAEAAAAAAATARPARRAAGTVSVLVHATAEEAEMVGALRLVSSQGFPGSMVAPKRQTDGTMRVDFERLTAGRYTLLTRQAKGEPLLLLHDLEVPAEGPCTDARLAAVSFTTGLHTRELRVVDPRGVPIAGAILWLRGASTRSDGRGILRVTTCDRAPLPARLEAEGRRPRELADVGHGATVELAVAGALQIAVSGLPEDLAGAPLQVWLRHEQRERLYGPQERLGADGTAQVAVPLEGTYLLQLLLETRRGNGGSSATLIAVRPEPVVLATIPPARVEWQLSAEVVERLRQELAQRAAPAQKK